MSLTGFPFCPGMPGDPGLPLSPWGWNTKAPVSQIVWQDRELISEAIKKIQRCPASTFTFGPGSPGWPSGPDLPGRPASPWWWRQSRTELIRRRWVPNRLPYGFCYAHTFSPSTPGGPRSPTSPWWPSGPLRAWRAHTFYNQQSTT